MILVLAPIISRVYFSDSFFPLIALPALEVEASLFWLADGIDLFLHIFAFVVTPASAIIVCRFVFTALRSGN